MDSIAGVSVTTLGSSCRTQKQLPVCSTSTSRQQHNVDYNCVWFYVNRLAICNKYLRDTLLFGGALDAETYDVSVEPRPYPEAIGADLAEGLSVQLAVRLQGLRLVIFDVSFIRLAYSFSAY